MGNGRHNSRTLEYLGPILGILLPIGIGIGLRQFRVFDEEDGSRIRRFCIQFTVPLLVFSSMYSAQTEVFGQLGPMVVSMLLMTACFFGVGYLGSLVTKDKAERAAIHASTTFGNYGWIGWAVANVVLGADGFQRAVFFTSMWWPSFYSYGLLIGIVHNESEERRGVLIITLKRLAPVAIALATGITFNLAKITVPDVLYSTIRNFGDMSVSLILLTVGLHLKFSSLIGHFPKALLVSLLRFIPGPIIGIAVAALGKAVFGLDEISVRVVLLNSALPVATIIAVLGDNYPMKTDIVGASIVLSTVLSLVVLPIWIIVIEYIPL
jgi:malate permease and related proteins